MVETSEDDGFACFLLVLGDLLEEGVDDGDGEHDTRAGANSTHEVRKDAKGTDADSTEASSGVDITTNVLDHSFLAKAVDDHLLVHQVADNVARSGARDVDPDAGKEGARAHHERAVEQEVEWVLDHVPPLAGRADVVG